VCLKSTPIKCGATIVGLAYEKPELVGGCRHQLRASAGQKFVEAADCAAHSNRRRGKYPGHASRGSGGNRRTTTTNKCGERRKRNHHWEEFKITRQGWV